MACRDILRAEFSHWLQQSLIYEQAGALWALLWNSDYPGKPISEES